MARRKNDFYPTPEAQTLALLDRYPQIANTSVYEPCAGRNHITHVLRGVGCEVETADIDPAMGHDRILDAAKDWPLSMKFDWVITNPPFGGSEEIWKNIARNHEGHFALLLPISWLEPVNKRETILAHISCPMTSLCCRGTVTRGTGKPIFKQTPGWCGRWVRISGEHSQRHVVYTKSMLAQLSKG